jgi:hypothetical protein
VTLTAFNFFGSTITETSRSSLASTFTLATPGIRLRSGRILEHRDVAQIGGRQGSRDVEFHHREERRCHTLGADCGACRHVGASFVNFSLHQLQGVHHVDVGTEHNRELRRTSNRPRAHAADAEHLARRLLESPCD